MIPLTVSIANFLVSYYLNSNMIIDERAYATQSYLLYRDRKVPEIYPLLPFLTVGPLTLFGIDKWAFVFVPFASTLLTVITTYYLSLNQFGSQTRGLLASILVAANPLLIWLSAKHMTENLFALLLVLVFLSVSRKELKYRDTLLAGIFSFLAYLCRYPGLLLFPIVTIWLISKRVGLRNLLMYLTPLAFMAGYWTLNWSVFGRFLTTETYSFGTLLAKSGTISLHWNISLLANMSYKVVAALALVFGYSLIFIFPQLKKIHVTNPIVLFAIVYTAIHLGYYTILSLSWSFAWSIDHVARYLVPIFPIVASLSDFPSRNQRIGYALVFVSCLVGIIMGFYLTSYASLHSQVPISWDDFIKSLTS